MEHLAALVPKPRVNLTRFHGVLAPNSKHRALVSSRSLYVRFEITGTPYPYANFSLQCVDSGLLEKPNIRVSCRTEIGYEAAVPESE